MTIFLCEIHSRRQRRGAERLERHCGKARERFQQHSSEDHSERLEIRGTHTMTDLPEEVRPLMQEMRANTAEALQELLSEHSYEARRHMQRPHRPGRGR